MHVYSDANSFVEALWKVVLLRARMVREFWTEYRNTLGEMRSESRNVMATVNRAALEWTTEGASDGDTVCYDAVSILEIEGHKTRSPQVGDHTPSVKRSPAGSCWRRTRVEESLVRQTNRLVYNQHRKQGIRSQDTFQNARSMIVLDRGLPKGYTRPE